MKICRKCNKQFKILEVINGVKKNLCKRKYCLGCSPFGSHNTQKIETKRIDGKRKCPGCQIDKKLCEFGNRRGKIGNSAYCLVCYKDNSNVLERQRTIKMKAVQYKGGCCQHCGYNKYIGALEFHHLNESQKDFNISKYKLKNMDNKIKSELDKCLLLCVNCHREEHERLRLLKLAVPP